MKGLLKYFALLDTVSHAFVYIVHIYLKRSGSFRYYTENTAYHMHVTYYRNTTSVIVCPSEHVNPSAAIRWCCIHSSVCLLLSNVCVWIARRRKSSITGSLRHFNCQREIQRPGESTRHPEVLSDQWIQRLKVCVSVCVPDSHPSVNTDSYIICKYS